MDRHLLLLASAVQGSFIDDKLDEKIMGKYAIDCFSRVKRVCDEESEGDQEYIKFRMNSNVALVLACRQIREAPSISSLDDLRPVINSFPNLELNSYISLIRSLKNYRFLYGSLAWLPSDIVHKICTQFLIISNTVTPITLAMSEQLINALLFSFQYTNDIYEEVGSSLRDFLRFYKQNNVTWDTEANIKLAGYFFMYVIKSLKMICNFALQNDIVEPEYSCELATMMKNNWLKLSYSRKNCDSNIVGIVLDYLEFCERFMPNITVEVWVSWCEIKLPVPIVPNKNPMWTKSYECEKPKNVQLTIAHDVFRLLYILKSDNNPQTTEIKSKYQQLLGSLESFACDPSHDPDNDLTIEELIEQIQHKDGREHKLLSILLSRNNVFESETASSCAAENVKLVPPMICSLLLQNILKLNKENIPKKWLEIVLTLASNVSSNDLLSIIETNLSCGLDERLRSESFEYHLTSVFNQLAEQDLSSTSMDIIGQDKIIWLCLQSGRDVVSLAVNICVSLPGLSTVMVQALSTIPCVCTTVDPTNNISILTNVLKDRYANGFSPAEEKEYINLGTELFKENSKRSLLCIMEIFENIIFPNLIYNEENLSTLNIPLNMLNEACLVNHDIFKSGPKFSSLIITLFQIIDNTKNLQQSNYSLKLNIRKIASSILCSLIIGSSSSNKNYVLDFNFINNMIKDLSLHPTSLCPFSALMNNDASITNSPCRPSFIMQMFSSAEQISNPDNLLNSTEFNRHEWIWFLFQVLPHCSQGEWKRSLQLTMQQIYDENGVISTLEIYHQVLCLTCVYTSRVKLDEEMINTNGVIEAVDRLSVRNEDRSEMDRDLVNGISDETNGKNLDICVEYCFKMFSSVFMEYVNSILKNLPQEDQICLLSDIMCWWSERLDTFLCKSSWPMMLPAKIIDLLQDVMHQMKMNNIVTNTNIIQESHENDVECNTNEVKTLNQNGDLGCKNTEVNNNKVLAELKKIALAFVKFVPVNNYSSAIIRKFLNIYQ